MRDVGRLFWLILKAEGYDPGPDTSLAAAIGQRPKGEELTAIFQGKTISFGAKMKEGPWTVRFEPGGEVSSLQWHRVLGPEIGTWTVAEDQLCMTAEQRRCFAPVVNGDRIELFDRYGVMQIDAVVLPP
jgi:hypothetical protein